MATPRISNYDLAQDQARELFLTYDISPMVKKYGLFQDADFTYISFLGTGYRISRKTGLVERISGKTVSRANFEESLTIYDILCYAKKDASLSGEFCSVMQLEGIAKSSNPGGFMFSKFCRRLEGRTDALCKVCESLGGTPYPVGEVAYQIPLFDFLPIVLQFWDKDEDFPGQLMIKWDKNILQYMHFETTFYATGCLLHRIAEGMDGQ
ncbi:MAG: DUF3786 domain-containing protein [Ruminococcaceae bacterium]|nr:DUF3786 domain-containing protein [Oscillospiraceae bacterium]